ncbi:hypothetical protein [Acinetobacter brisouii]|uniref:hypothetical protein n=1 Tax=Acinetobacter brisouii TaxID=396323 RepID=UPI00124EF450|nr:hypothetical protein [Acinetobacter brisouii]
MKSIITDNDDALVVRNCMPHNHKLSLLKDIYVEVGTKEDWDKFKDLHYKGDELPVGPRIWRVMLNEQSIGVVVMAVPKTLLSGRNELFKHLRPNVNGKDNKLINQYRLRWINANVFVNSRTVLDTMYRGAGIAKRALNIAMRMSGKPIVEFQSSMSKFNRFAEHAGIVFSPPRRASNYERGLVFFNRWFDCAPQDFASVKEELDAMPTFVRNKCIQAMRDFYYQYSSLEKSGNNRMNGTKRVEGLTDDKLIKNLQQLVFASPLYGFYKNPDATFIMPGEVRAETHLPARISILSFDNQPIDAPLDMEKLHVPHCKTT